MLSAPQAQASLTSASTLGRLPAYVPQLRLVTPGPVAAPSCGQDVSAVKRAWSAREEEDPALTEPPDARRRCPKGAGAAQPAFRPFGVDRSLCSFVPRPGPLHRSLPAERAADAADDKSHTSSRSSCSTRNAISSSYSSTREFPSVQRRRGPARRQGRLPPRPPEKVSQDSPSCPAAPPVPCQMKNQRQQEAGATTGQKEPCKDRSPTSDCSRPRRRKIPLLPHRPGGPVRLPPAPELGFPVTAEDLDGEKKAALQRIDRALRGEVEGVSRCGSRCPSSALPGPAARAVVLPAVAPAPGLSAQRAEQDSPGPLAVLSPAAAESLRPPRVKRGRHCPRMGGEGGGSLPTNWVSGLTDASCAFPAVTSTSRTQCPSPMCVDCPVFSSRSSPPAVGPRAPRSRSLPVTCAVPSSPSSGTSAGLAPQPASDGQVTPMDCTPPCQPLLLGSPPGSSGSFFPSAQALPMPSRDSMGSVTATTGLHTLGLWSHSPPGNRPRGNPGTPAQPTFGATDGQCQGATSLRSAVPYGQRAAPASTAAVALTSALGRLSLGSATQVAFGGSSPTSCTSGTHAGTQPGVAATPAVVPPGTATAPSSMTNAGPNSRQPCPIAGGASPAPLSLGVGAAPAGLGRRQAAPGRKRTFGALSVTPQTSGAPSGTHRSGDSLGPNTRGHPCGSTPITTARASTQHNPVSGAPKAPRSSPDLCAPGATLGIPKATIQNIPKPCPALLPKARRALLALVSSPCAPGTAGCAPGTTPAARRQGTSQKAVRGPRPPRAHGPSPPDINHVEGFGPRDSAPAPGALPPGLGGHTCAEEGAGSLRPRNPSPRRKACAAAPHMRSEGPRGRGAGPGGGGAPRVPLQRLARTDPSPCVSKPFLQKGPVGGPTGARA
ncbi:putative POM121-like protein 1-like [Canis lupus familiaris]|uniref:putative POM121-like protein 1-like n=1 Tax=Canis lupus familiaris TaxID=9615 RepID=UPI0018F40435|nr:putative POM121-like protein 1-like [Canis lupus familiaris]